MVHSLNLLGKRIEWELIHRPGGFDTIDQIIHSYKGVDWKRYVKSNTYTYTELDTYYNRGVKISIATWLPGQYAMFNKGPETKYWVTSLKGVISAFTTDDGVTSSCKISTGDILYVDDDSQAFRNDSNELAVSLQVYYPHTVSRFV